jgi:hypothetical protein
MADQGIDDRFRLPASSSHRCEEPRHRPLEQRPQRFEPVIRRL